MSGGGWIKMAIIHFGKLPENVKALDTDQICVLKNNYTTGTYHLVLKINIYLKFLSTKIVLNYISYVSLFYRCESRSTISSVDGSVSLCTCNRAEPLNLHWPIFGPSLVLNLYNVKRVLYTLSNSRAPIANIQSEFNYSFSINVRRFINVEKR